MWQGITSDSDRPKNDVAVVYIGPVPDLPQLAFVSILSDRRFLDNGKYLQSQTSFEVDGHNPDFCEIIFRKEKRKKSNQVFSRLR